MSILGISFCPGHAEQLARFAINKSDMALLQGAQKVIVSRNCFYISSAITALNLFGKAYFGSDACFAIAAISFFFTTISCKALYEATKALNVQRVQNFFFSLKRA